MRVLVWRWLQLALLGAASLAAMGASDLDARYTKLSHGMMCTCGCAQILGECNHVGCPNSGGMLNRLHRDVAAGMSDRSIYQAFAVDFGQSVLAAPMFTRWNRAAWYVPPSVLMLGLLAAVVALWRWRRRGAAPSAVAPVVPSGDPALEQVRRETREL